MCCKGAKIGNKGRRRCNGGRDASTFEELQRMATIAKSFVARYPISMNVPQR